ncbi:Protein of unknown function [Gryllus bimaculatus]|nr:Protein of unknown function [Gryllus bimaculatus]
MFEIGRQPQISEPARYWRLILKWGKETVGRTMAYGNNEVAQNFHTSFHSEEDFLGIFDVVLVGV